MMRRLGFLMLQLLSLLIILQICEALRQPSFANSRTRRAPRSDNNDYSYRTYYIEQRVDQFSWATAATYKQRYLLADQFFRPGGPILFYTGNEGAIDWFCNNTGFMWDIAPSFNGLLVFAEHRYYGDSMPFGNESFSSREKAGYLTVEQALADFATLLLYIKSNASYADAPVIAFGGSYGGMLSAYFRMKYPEIVTGALAASAPIWQFRDFVPCDTFAKIVKRTFQESGDAGPLCVQNIANSWPLIEKASATLSGRAKLVKVFSLCEPLISAANVSAFKDWLVNVYGNLAMGDYPYPAGFLEPLPAWPVNAFCQKLNVAPQNPDDILTLLAGALGVYFNYTGDAKCFDYNTQAVASLSDSGWDYQTCTEMTMPMCANGQTDIFYPSNWDLAAFSAGCMQKYGVSPDVDRIVREFGGLNIQQYSNIIFSNGYLDPWSGGGVNRTLSNSLLYVDIQQGAHHLDLRASNPADPQSVIDARNFEIGVMRRWLSDHEKERRKNKYYSAAIRGKLL